MADTNSDLVAKQVAALTGLSGGILNGDDAGGVLLHAQPIVTLPAGVTANDTFQLLDLPPGAVLIPELCSIVADADPGTTLTVDVGIAGNADLFADGVNMGGLSAAGIVLFTAPAIPDAVFTPYRTTDKTRVFATAATAGTVTAGVKLKFNLVFRIKG